MLSTLSRRSLSFRLSRAACFTLNKQYQPSKIGLHTICEKDIRLHPSKKATLFGSGTKFSIKTMSSTPSLINLQALGNNFVKTVPSMEVIGHKSVLLASQNKIKILASKAGVSLEGYYNSHNLFTKIRLYILSTISHGNK